MLSCAVQGAESVRPGQECYPPEGIFRAQYYPRSALGKSVGLSEASNVKLQRDIDTSIVQERATSICDLRQRIWSCRVDALFAVRARTAMRRRRVKD